MQILYADVNTRGEDWSEKQMVAYLAAVPNQGLWWPCGLGRNEHEMAPVRKLSPGGGILGH